MGGVTNISDSNQTDDNDNTKVVITGGDDAFIADVIEEANGEKKLLVRATSSPETLGAKFFKYAKNGSSEDMNVDGSTTPVEFILEATGTEDYIVEELRFECLDGNIKLDKFLGENNELTNGVLIEIKSEDTIFQFIPIRNTIEFDTLFAFGTGGEFQLITSSSVDAIAAKFSPSSPFRVCKQGTYTTDDYVKVIIQDDISSIDRLRLIVFGSEE